MKKNCEWLSNDFEIDFKVRGIYEPGEPRQTQIRHRSFLEKVFGVIKSLI